jgi:cysteine synthase
VAAKDLATQLGPGKRVVPVACDNGIKYPGGHLYS